MTTRAGCVPATRRTVNCGSSAIAVPTPITTASTKARRRCKWVSPAGPLIYLEWPDSVAMRPSSDWPIWPTTTRSSTAPRRSGPKISSQGCGKGWSPARKILLNSNHGSEDPWAADPAVRLSVGKFLNGMAAKSTPTCVNSGVGAIRLAQIRPICERNDNQPRGVLTLAGSKNGKSRNESSA